MPLITLNNGKSFESDPDVSLLEAASRANVRLPYSCRMGRCNTCRCKVLSGSSTALHPEEGLSEQEKAEGWILGCVRAATTDMIIDIEDLGDLQPPPARILPCRVHALERLAVDVVRVELRLPPTSAFVFLPGQYVDVIGNAGIRRSYSIANGTPTGNVIELHIRDVPGGVMSEYWFGQAKPGDLLRLNGPLGAFFLRNAADLHLVFLATGTGIAPVKAMLEGIATAPQDEWPRSLSVYWGGRTPDDLYWVGINTVSGCRYVPVLSRASEDWPGARGHVQDVFLATGSDLAQTVVYAAGSDTMILSARNALVKAGLPARRFFSDAFVRSGTP